MIKSKNTLVGHISTKRDLSGKLSNAIVNVYPDLEDLEVTPTSVEQNFKSSKYGYDNVKVKAVESDNLEITPTLEGQEYVGLYGKVNVNPATEVYDEAIQKAYDTFWDTFQNNGERTSYAFAFYGDTWNDTTFNPKYKMIPVNANSMFDGCKSVTKPLTNDIVDFSLCTNFYQTFRELGSREVGVIDTSKYVGIYSYTFTKMACEKIEKIILPDMVSKNTTFNITTFQGMNNLIYIRFEGVIGKGIFLASSQKLDSGSAENILLSLNDYKGTSEEYSYTVTLPNAVWERLNAEIPSPVGDSWQEYASSKGWNV
jgi:hypothetical protein